MKERAETLSPRCLANEYGEGTASSFICGLGVAWLLVRRLPFSRVRLHTIKDFFARWSFLLAGTLVNGIWYRTLYVCSKRGGLNSLLH